MKNIKCNVCGEEPLRIEIGIHQPIGYGSSQHDGDTINLDVCPNCVDRFLAAIAEVCKIYPIHIEDKNKYNKESCTETEQE